MAANLRDLRTRIRSVQKTQQITKAMKVVSAAKLGRSQIALAQAAPYLKGLEGLAAQLLEMDPVAAGSQLLATPNGSPMVVCLVLSSTRGLCGGFNANVAKLTLATLDQLGTHHVRVGCVGKKAFGLIQRKWSLWDGRPVQHEHGRGTVTPESLLKDPEVLLRAGRLACFDEGLSRGNPAAVRGLADAYLNLYRAGVIGRCLVLYNRFQSAMVQIPSVATLLPVEYPPSTGQERMLPPRLEPGGPEMLEALLPQLVRTRLANLVLETAASEHGARMSAMDSATRNGRDMERRLKLTYQRARQASITNELIEIISGAEVL